MSSIGPTRLSVLAALFFGLGCHSSPLLSPRQIDTISAGCRGKCAEGSFTSQAIQTVDTALFTISSPT